MKKRTSSYREKKCPKCGILHRGRRPCCSILCGNKGKGKLSDITKSRISASKIKYYLENPNAAEHRLASSIRLKALRAKQFLEGSRKGIKRKKSSELAKSRISASKIKYNRENPNADAHRKRSAINLKSLRSKENNDRIKYGLPIEPDSMVTVDDFSLAIPNIPQLNQFVEDGDIWETTDYSDW